MRFGTRSRPSFRQPLEDRCKVEAVAASAVTTVREIQVLQAPHIADADDAAMTRIEQEMATSETNARTALQALGPLLGPVSASRSRARRRSTAS